MTESNPFDADDAIDADGNYVGPTMAMAMEELAGGFDQILKHNREHHPELDQDAARHAFDESVTAVRTLLQLGLDDTPATWEAVLTGFLYGAQTTAALEMEELLPYRMGMVSANETPTLLYLQLAMAQRWAASKTGDSDVLAGIQAATEAATGGQS